MARHSFRKSPRAHRMKLYMFVELIANLPMMDWSSGLVGWESFIKLLCLHAYSLYATCRKRFIKLYSDRIWWLLCCFWELECSWNEGGWFNCLFISYTSLHECEQVYMRVNSCDLLCNIACKSQLRCWLTEERHTCWLGYISEKEKPRSVLSSSILWLFLCQISYCLKMHCMIYSVQDAESECSLVNGNVSWVPLSLSESKWVLISAPDKKQVFATWVHIWDFYEQISCFDQNKESVLQLFEVFLIGCSVQSSISA